MNKIIFPIVIVLIFSVSVIIKIMNKKHILENAVQTEGTVIEEFDRGKLPYCKYSYSIGNIKYTKTQEVPKQLKNKILNKQFTVTYQADKPKEAFIDLK